MGFNSTVVVLNDCLGAIEKDRAFGRNLADAIRRMHLRPGAPAEVCADNCVNAAAVVEQHHCDGRVVVMVGGNTGWSLSSDREWTADDVTVLRNVAERHGYTLTRKRKPATRAARGAGAR
ncbi:MAG: hypothetical protein ACJ79R_22210 [Anaeromyxobacteraceae bacterium]